MKRVRFLVIFVFIAVIVLVSPSCAKKVGEAEWKADIETVDGVKTIRNPATPRYGEFTFNLVQDLVIGEEKDEARFFPKGAWLRVDGEGWMYVSDDANERIQVFDHNGKFLRSLGRRGQGPGEFRSAGFVFFDDENRPYVWDAFRFVGFNRDGSFRENRPLQPALNRAMMGPGGIIVGKPQPRPRADGELRNEIIQFGPDGGRLRTLAEYPVYGVSKDTILMHWYTGEVSFCRRSGDSLYCGFSLDETIRVIDKEGRTLFAFSKVEARIPISGEEADLTRKEGLYSLRGRTGARVGRDKADLGMPDYRPFYLDFFSDAAGRLYVIRFKPITEKDDPTYKVDVYSKDGYYLYRTTWPFLPRAMNGGYFYDVREDEDQGLFKVIRYKITNWAEFKDK